MVFAESNALYHSDCVTILLHWNIVNDNYFGISNEFWLSVFVVEPSSNHFFSPRRSSIESFGYYHFLRVDDYGAAAHATKPARLRLVVSALVAEARLVFGACHFLARGTPVPSACVATRPGATLLIFMRLRTADLAQ